MPHAAHGAKAGAQHVGTNIVETTGMIDQNGRVMRAAGTALLREDTAGMAERAGALLQLFAPTEV